MSITSTFLKLHYVFELSTILTNLGKELLDATRTYLHCPFIDFYNGDDRQYICTLVVLKNSLFI